MNMRRTTTVIVRALPAQREALASDARVTMYVGGVGAGKSWTGVLWCMMAPPGTKILVVAPSYRVLRDGTAATLRALCPGVRLHTSAMVATLPNGTTMILRSADGIDEAVRSVEVDRVWFEEAAYLPRAAITTAMGRTRASRDGRLFATTTPRRRAAVHSMWVADPAAGARIITARTTDNPYLSADVVEALRRDYGERLSRQELDGEWLDVTGGLWSEAEIPVSEPPKKAPRQRIIGLDPNAGGGGEVGIVLIGVYDDGRAWVLDDASGRYTASEWPGVVCDLARSQKARVVAEVNNGGDMVERVLRATDRSIRVETVRAVRSKRERAAPVAAMYRQGLVSHAGEFGRLVAQMTQWDPDDSEGSPDRLDALVWALTYAGLTPRTEATDAGARALLNARPAHLSRLRT